MREFNRVILLVLDSVGIGELPDASEYGDEGANTLCNIAKNVGGLDLPNLQAIGLGNIESINGIRPIANPNAYYGKMAEASVGKDTITGHWEMAGICIGHPFNTYPNGFPEEVIDQFIKGINKSGVLGNKPASGTDIIEEYGEQHLQTGWPIVYTSADSVFQIAAHEEVIPIEELYDICKVARTILHGEHAVARVIARPFIGDLGKFQRTANRKDFSVSPPTATILDRLIDKHINVTAIGKINDIFNGQGITKSYKSVSNYQGLQLLEQQLKEADNGLIFTNLVDFDMLYGHRNDIVGYAKALKEVDDYLPRILSNLRETDLLIITADHGCDPTTVGTDHTREYVPLLVYHNNVTKGHSLGVRNTFADIAATIAEIFQVQPTESGVSFYRNIIS